MLFCRQVQETTLFTRFRLTFVHTRWSPYPRDQDQNKSDPWDKETNGHKQKMSRKHVNNQRQAPQASRQERPNGQGTPSSPGKQEWITFCFQSVSVQIAIQSAHLLDPKTEPFLSRPVVAHLPGFWAILLLRISVMERRQARSLCPVCGCRPNLSTRGPSGAQAPLLSY